MPRNQMGSYVLDARPDRVDLRDREYHPPLRSLPKQYPQKKIVEHYLPQYQSDGMILDQQSEGACTGFGLAAVVNCLRWQAAVASGTPPPRKVSERMAYHLAQIYDEWPGEDYEGSSCRGAMKGWHHHGICEENFWKYKPGKFTKPKKNWEQNAAEIPLGAYYRINNNSVVDMQAAISEVGAVYVSAHVHEGWSNVPKSKKSLVEIPFSASRIGGHAFAIVGYETRGFIVQNSWGPDWGYLGFALLPYHDWVMNGTDAWVAVLGAPVTVAEKSVTRTTQSLQQQGAGSQDNPLRVVFSETDPAVMPWSESEAYLHSVVLGNEGLPINRLIGVENAADAVKQIGLTQPSAWLQKHKKNKLVVYAHGGLNDEQASIKRVRVLAPYFKANGIYPIFLTWKTGIWESLVSSIEDSVTRIFRGEAPPIAEGWLLNKTKEARDRAIEAAGQRFLKFIWTEMKENAAAGARTVGGLWMIANHLDQLASSIDDLEIHLVGHSAGSIIHGHLLDRLAAREVTVRGVALFAPACTVAFATRYYGGSVKKATLKPKDLHIDLMSDERELADSVGPYGKSLLYLVSRALEDVHKMPLLGMAASWDPNANKPQFWRPDMPRKDVWKTSKLPDIHKWLSVFGKGTSPKVHDVTRERVFDGVEHINLAHGSFDNDVDVISATIKRIAGKQKLKHPVENLHGF